VDNPGDVPEQRGPDDHENVEYYEPDAQDDFDDMYIDYPLPDVPQNNPQLPVVQLPEDIQEGDTGTDAEILDGVQVRIIPFFLL